MAKHRSPGEGSLYHRADGRWEARLTVGRKPDGQPLVWHGYAKTRREVSAKLDQARENRRAGRPVIPERQTVAQYLSWWLDSCCKPPLTRPGTYTGYEQKVRLYLIPALGDLQLGRLTGQDVQAMVGRLSDRGLSPRTVSYAVSTLHAALTQAVRFGRLPSNVAEHVRRPKPAPKERHTLSIEQARALVEVSHSDRLGALYVLTMALGLRQGEALGLRWADVDLEAATLRTVLAVQRVDHKLVLVDLKTAKSKQTLPLPAFVVFALHEHRKRQLEERLSASTAWQDRGMVFTTGTGNLLDGTVVTHRFQKLLASASLPHLSFHELRHTCATLLMAMGTPLPVIRDVLRHTQIGMTADVYSHVSPLLARESLDRLGELLGGE